MADVMNAFLSGHQAGQAENEHAQRLEENKLRTLVLKHEIDRLKIDDQVRARELAQKNLEYLHGQPSADIPSDTVTSQQPNLPSQSLAGVVNGLVSSRLSGNMSSAPDAAAAPSPNQEPLVQLQRLLATPAGAPVPSFTPAPAAQDTVTGTNPVPRRIARAVDIPGVPGLNVPGVSVRPRSMEEINRSAIALKRAEQPPVTTPPGGVTSQINPETGQLEPIVQNTNLPATASLDAHLLDAVSKGNIGKQRAVLATMGAAARAKGQSLADQYASALQDGDQARADTMLKAMQNVAHATKDPAMEALAVQTKQLQLQILQQSTGQGAAPPGDWSKTGDEFLSTIPEQWRKTIEKIARYEEDPSKAASMRGGMKSTVLQWVNQVNPGYKADEFTNRAPTRKAFTTGTQGQQINAMNTAIGHLDQFAAVADALHNGSFAPGNALWNSVKKTFGSKAPTNFATLKEFLDGELGSVVKKGAATEGEMGRLQEQIRVASSPDQLKGYIETAIPILGSKLSSLDYQYHQAMGADDTFSALSPDAKTALTKFGFDPEHPTLGGPATATPAAAGVLKQVKLQDGQIQVTAPDGSPHLFSTQAAADRFKAAVQQALAKGKP